MRAALGGAFMNIPSIRYQIDGNARKWVDAEESRTQADEPKKYKR